MNGQHASQADGVSAQQLVAVKEYDGQTDKLVDMVGRMREVAQKVSSPLILVSGGLLLLCALIAKITVFDLAIFTLTTGEFITLVVAGALLIAFDAFVRFYEFRSRNLIVRDHQKLGSDLVLDLAQTSGRLLSEGGRQGRPMALVAASRCGVVRGRGRHSYTLRRVSA